MNNQENRIKLMLSLSNEQLEEVGSHEAWEQGEEELDRHISTFTTTDFGDWEDMTGTAAEEYYAR